ncbi:MAG: DUF433 domain-containing protein [bacterium]|nr:DUF433 domain-containing protein [bacterium]
MRPENVVSCNEKVMSGVPVFAGTRVPVESLIAHLQAGDRLDDFLAGFPTVTREQATAFLEIALRAVLEGRHHARTA